jgi:hypothetical protein
MNIWHLVYFIISTSLFVWLLVNYIRVLKFIIGLSKIKEVAEMLCTVAHYYDFITKENH